ncbi:MAG: chromosome condensation regulator, partial [Planctomycetota bacterium]|nr:chromosome condensation regulator [Planctomycetota bacterium]
FCTATPVQVVDPSDPTGFLTGVTAVAAGFSHTVALLGDGTLRAWGSNAGGQLGAGTTSTFRTTPVQVVDPSDPTGFLAGVTAVAAGQYHTVTLR